ncbi:MAG: integrase core domain-containing protein [Thermoplasmatales archaeon]|nr:integrase core domain-containing protein [Thermoplasmatales archaeon]
MKQLVKPYDGKRPVRFDVEGSGEIQTFTLPSKLFRKAMKLLGIRLEYIQKQTLEDNGNIESFHNSIKTDYIWPVDISDFQERRDIIDHAFVDYNEKRPHSSIMFLSPRAFRKRWDSDPGFRLEYKNYVKKMKDKEMERRKNKKRTEVERNGIL